MNNKKQKKAKKPRVLSYEEKHNRHYGYFSKASRVLLWAGIINVVSLLVSIIQAYTNEGSSIYFYFCFGFNDLIFKLLYNNVTYFSTSGMWLYIIIIILIAMISSAGSVLLSINAAKGKKFFLWFGFGFYIIDTLLIALCYYFGGESITSIWFMIAFHAIIIAFQCVSLYEYYKIVALAKQYGMLKAKEESEGQKDGTIKE